jgi:hypothetical protein
MKNGAYVNLISYENIEDEIWCGVRTDMVGVHKNKIDVGVSIFLQDVADHNLLSLLLTSFVSTTGGGA